MKKMIMSNLQRKIRWLNYRGSVVGSDTYSRKVIQSVK